MKKLIFILTFIFIFIVGFSQTTTITNKMIIVHRSWGDHVVNAIGGKVKINGYDSLTIGNRIFYVDPVNGNDTNSGLSTSQAWKTLSRTDTTLTAGDIVALKRASNHIGSILVSNSGTVNNPISFSSFGRGTKPIVNNIILDTINYSNVSIKDVNGINIYYNRTFFVSNSGNDSNNALTPETPWQNISKVNSSSFSAGDQVLFENGDVWREQLTVPSSGTAGSPITFGAYGTGADPIIDGADALSYISPVYNGSNVWAETPTTNSSNTTYYNFRQGTNALSASGTKIRVRFYASTGAAMTIGGASFGKRRSTSGDDFVEIPIRLTFGGSNTYTIASSGNIYSDWVDYNAQKDSLYLIHTYMTTPAGYRYGTSTAPSYRSTSSTDNTMTQTIDYGGSIATVRIAFEVQIGNPVTNMYEKIAVTTQPFITWYNDTIAPLAADTAALDIDGEWFWDTTSKVWYMYATSNPVGKVQLGQRGILVDASNRNNITISNLTLQHSNNNNTVGYTGTRGAIYMYQGSNLTVTGCTIQDNSLHGIFTINSSHITIDNNTLLRNGTMNWNGRNVEIKTLADWATVGRYYTFTNNTSSYAGADGLMILAGTYDYPVKHITISGNTFNNNAAAGCYPVNSDTTVIFNNTFANNGDATKTGEDYAIGVQSGSNIDIYNNTITNQVYNDAIQVWAGTGVPSHNARVFYNYISGVKDGDGISFIQGGENSMQNGEIFYNVVDSASNYGIILERSIGSVNSYTTDVFNNTIYNCGKASVYANYSYPAILKNNIFNSDGTEPEVYYVAGTSGLTSSNNLWYRASGNVLNYGGTTYTTSTITNFEASAQNTDPLFVGSGLYPFSLQTGSPAINTGVNVGLTTDILGNPIVDNPDIGAYETPTLINP